MNIQSIVEAVPGLAEEFASERQERQSRKEAHREDFDRLRELGVHLMSVPVELGGTWESLAQSARPICTALRLLAHGDPSVSLVSAMHPGVLATWRVPQVPEPYSEGWTRQRKEVFETVLDGCWWGTIVSEPGSGGDVTKTRSVMRPTGEPHKYRLSGQKHFGSGSGVTSFMTTRALAEGDTQADAFYMDVRNTPWDGSTGMRLTAPWAGRGMMSTNSHAFEFTDFPATRAAWPGHAMELQQATGPLGQMMFSSVVVGVVDVAMEFTRGRLEREMARGAALRAYQRVEWSHAEQEAWLVDKAFHAAVAEFDNGTQTLRNTLLAKESIATLSESVLTRLCKLLGGSSYTWYSPLSTWFEDVRALGYLRPPWALAFDQLFDLSWPGYGDSVSV